MQSSPVKWIFLLGLLVGCGSAPTTIGLRGDVSYRGAPISKGMIDFVPTDDTRGSIIMAPIRDGKYEVIAERGVQIGGTYLIRVIGFKESGEMFRGLPVEKNFIPEQHNSKTTLKVRIADLSDKNKADFQLP